MNSDAILANIAAGPTGWKKPVWLWQKRRPCICWIFFNASAKEIDLLERDGLAVERECLQELPTLSLYQFTQASKLQEA